MSDPAPPPLTCAALFSASLGTHTECYVDNGFCSNVLADTDNWPPIWNIIDFGDFIQWHAIKNVGSQFVLNIDLFWYGSLKEASFIHRKW